MSKYKQEEDEALKSDRTEKMDNLPCGLNDSLRERSKYGSHEKAEKKTPGNTEIMGKLYKSIQKAFSFLLLEDPATRQQNERGGTRGEEVQWNMAKQRGGRGEVMANSLTGGLWRTPRAVLKEEKMIRGKLWQLVEV